METFIPHRREVSVFDRRLHFWRFLTRLWLDCDDNVGVRCAAYVHRGQVLGLENVNVSAALINFDFQVDPAVPFISKNDKFDKVV